MKKLQNLFLILLFLIIISFIGNSSQAMTKEGHVEGGGLVTYPTLFKDSTGILIVTSNFENNSGIETADITVVAICFDPTSIDGIDKYRTIRLRVYDSDINEFFNPDKELGIGTKERRLSVSPHMDKDQLIWTVQVTDEEGIVIFAQINLLYYYDPESVYDPVISTTDTNVMQSTEHEKILRQQKLWDFAGYTVFGGFGVLLLVLYIRRRF